MSKAGFANEPTTELVYGDNLITAKSLEMIRTENGYALANVAKLGYARVSVDESPVWLLDNIANRIAYDRGVL